MSSLSAMWRDARNPPADPTHLSFKGKAVLVTGANSGLGYAAAVKYAAQGASPLILAVRTEEKGEQAKADIIRQAKCSPDIFVILALDLSTFASVREFADRLNERVPALHVAQLAAGIATFSFEKSPEGYESALQVDVLSTALLGLLLLPKLRETAAAAPSSGDGFVPHLSFLNSVAHLEVTADMVPPGQTLVQLLNDPAKFDNQKQYFLIKLASWFVVQGLVDRCRNDPHKIAINANCPGLCKTNMNRNFPGFVKVIMAIQYFIVGRSSEQGARTLVSATALGPESNGKFWKNDGYPPPSELLTSERGTELYRETWEEILTILRKHVDSSLI